MKQNGRLILVISLFLLTISANAQKQFLGEWMGELTVSAYNGQQACAYPYIITLTGIKGNILSGKAICYAQQQTEKVLGETDFKITLKPDYKSGIATANLNTDKIKNITGRYIVEVSLNGAELKGKFMPNSSDAELAVNFSVMNYNMDVQPSGDARLKAESTQVITVVADRIYEMKEGLAVIKKGNVYAVIDKTGKIVIPFGKYVFDDIGGKIENVPVGFLNGSCVVALPDNIFRLGLIDPQGKLIIPCENFIVRRFDREGWAQVTDPAHKCWFVNRTGQRISVSSVFLEQKSNYSGGRSLTSLFSGTEYGKEGLSGLINRSEFSSGLSPGKLNGLWGYFDRTGKEVIKANYYYAAPFSEGLACVSKKNEYQEIKYGFINSKAETVVPFNFSRRPGNFSSGLAYVEPKDQTEYKFCFINKNGEPLFKQKNGGIYDENEFKDGYFRIKMPPASTSKITILNSDGIPEPNFTTIIDKIRPRIDGWIARYTLVNGIQKFDYQNTDGKTYAGFVNLKTGQILLTKYANASSFDPISELSLANDGSDNDVLINFSGKVVMKRAGSKNEF